MKLLTTFILLAMLCISCDNDNEIFITLTNPSDIDLTDKPIRMKVNSEMEGHPIIVTSTGDTIPSQLDDIDNDGVFDELFFVMDFPANATKKINVAYVDEAPSYEMRTSVRAGKQNGENSPVKNVISSTLLPEDLPSNIGYVAYQTDGPTFENDLAGFRHYFDGRNSKDLYSKTSTDISPESVGIGANGMTEDNYHTLQPWGRDVLSTGNSVGIGGINVMIGDKISRIGNIAGATTTNVESSSFNIYKEGPVRSILDFEHKNWQPYDHAYQVKERVMIWPGTYAFQNNVSVSGLQGDESLLVGLVNSNNDNPLEEVIINDKYVALITHDKQTYDKTWWLGLALILPRDSYMGHGEASEEGVFETSFYAKMKLSDNEPVTYYALGGCELSDKGFVDADYFKSYVVDLASQMSVDIIRGISE